MRNDRPKAQWRTGSQYLSQHLSPYLWQYLSPSWARLASRVNAWQGQYWLFLAPYYTPAKLLVRHLIKYCSQTKYWSKSFISVLLLLLAATFTLAELNSKQARKLIANIPGLAFSPDLVTIKSITPTSGGGAIIEAQFATAFRVEKGRDAWRVAEVRLGNGRWEDLELVTTAIKMEKIRRTRQQLTQLGTALANYYQQQGRYPMAKDIFQLTDLLVPQYFNSLIREDLWGQPLEYSLTSNGYRLQSHGPDGKPRTQDEIILENGNFQN